MRYFRRFLANITANPSKWAGGVVLALVWHLLEHRFLEWTNKEIDKGAGSMLVYVRDILSQSIDHPLWSAFAALAAYSIIMIVWAHIAALKNTSTRSNSERIVQTATPQPATVARPIPLTRIGFERQEGKPETVRVEVPGEIELQVTANEESTGLRAVVINNSGKVVHGCKLIVEDARSYDRRRSPPILRESSGLKRYVIPYESIAPGDIASTIHFKRNSMPLVSIRQDQLELGNTVNDIVLRWPGGDASEIQAWSLTLRLEAEGLQPCTIPLLLEWNRLTNRLRIILDDFAS